MKSKGLLYLLTLICSMGVLASCSNEDDNSSEANIVSFKFVSDGIQRVPVINNEKGEVVFMAAVGTDLTNLVPIIEVSPKATVSPACGVKQDFTKPVKYTVTAENGAVKVYTVIGEANHIYYDFEEWVEGVKDQEPENAFYEVANGWSSSNTGALFLKAFGFADKFVVTETTDAKVGLKAARIETIDTKGVDMTFVKVPRVTSGSLFIGKFVTNVLNTLNSTKFGMEFSRKPISLKGYYKYTPGKEYYRCESPATCNAAILDPNTVDQCSINAVLYEVSTFDAPKDPDDSDDPGYAEYLTGADVKTSEKIVAVATLADGSAKAEYTQFDLKFNYLKPYDATKKYRFAIICSSSNDGDKFNGAPGSVLFVDGFELVVE